MTILIERRRTDVLRVPVCFEVAVEIQKELGRHGVAVVRRDAQQRAGLDGCRPRRAVSHRVNRWQDQPELVGTGQLTNCEPTKAEPEASAANSLAAAAGIASAASALPAAGARADGGCLEESGRGVPDTKRCHGVPTMVLS